MIVIHDKEEARSALQGGLFPCHMITAPGLVVRAGIPWIRDVRAWIATNYPNVDYDLLLDCGDDAARVMEAIHAGLGPILYTGPAARYEKLRQMGAKTGISVYSSRPETE